MKKRVSALTITFFFIWISLAMAGNGKIGGKVYYEYTLNLSKNSGSANEFEFHRVYFGYKKTLNENIKFNFTTDVGRENNSGKLDLYLKYAYADYKTAFGNFIIGMQPLNIFKIMEKAWGYRFLEKSPMDLYKWASSADLGIGYRKKLNEKTSFDFIISNGPGYKKEENDKYKKYSVNLNFGESELTWKRGYSTGFVVAYEPYEYAQDSTRGKTLFAVYGAYSTSKLRLGAEIDFLKDSGPEITKQIVSGFAIYRINKKTEFLGRVDYYDSNIDIGSDGQYYLIGGVNFMPSKEFYIAPNIRFTEYQQDGKKNDILAKINFQIKF